MAEPKRQSQHPWSKFYKDRGQPRPVVVDLANPDAAKARAQQARIRRALAATEAKPPPMSAELQAAVEAVTAQTYVPGVTAAPFITAMQREAVVRELKRRRWLRWGRIAAVVVAVLVALHLVLSTTVFRQPFEAALQAHVRDLPAQVLPLYDSLRQPLRAEGVVITQADRIDGSTMRYVAAVTLRLRKPLYTVAVSNGTLTYRRLQEAVVLAREQEMRYNLFPPAEAPEFPKMPLLLQRTHQAGETMVVRVPFTARRFGWSWQLGAPPLELRAASRTLDGDSLDYYADTPVLVFGDPATLPEIRRRIKIANTYVVTVTKAVQRQAGVMAVAAEPPRRGPSAPPSDATRPVGEGPGARPVVDPDAPAVPEGFDPNAPALPGRVDPNAPAVEEPVGGRPGGETGAISVPGLRPPGKR